MKNSIKEELLNAAWQVRKNSYSPYSKFAVGAAVLTGENRIFTGTNIENSSFGLTVCAERVALQSALSAGMKDIKAIAIVTESEKDIFPCGACLQVIKEFVNEIPIYIATEKDVFKEYSLSKLFPQPFTI